MIAQRLVRTICLKCREEYQPEPELLREIGFPLETAGKFFRGRGCEECRFTGYRGRTGMYEILVMHENLRPLIIERTSSTTLKQAAIANGMTTLRDDGWAKVRAGITTVEEVGRVTLEDEAIIGT
jgi:type II secretory ATPase GspE/PulE/Tfp pilus assembly ATPase PilB-like protein